MVRGWPWLLLAIFGWGLFFVTSEVFAVTLNKSSYGEGEDIIVTSKATAGQVQIGFFVPATDSFVNAISITDVPASVLYELDPVEFAAFVAGSYSAVEFVYDGAPDCDQVSYSVCLGLSDFRHEVKFDIKAKASGVAASGPAVSTPRIKLFGSLKGKLVSGLASIRYEAFDKDDTTDKKKEHGLAPRPANFYYAAPGSFDWIAVARDQDATGTIVWDTSKLRDDKEYRFKATAIGVDNDFSQVVVEDITVDNTPPNFTVKASPTFTRGEPVRFEIESSEVVKRIPTSTVTQFNHDPVKFPLVGDTTARKFAGTYEITSGFDGPAKVAIEGEDLAGNVGTIMLGDETVAVGIKPPPPPVVEIPSDKEISTPTLPSLSGFGVNAVRVVLKINGEREYVAENLKKGRFEFKNIALDPFFNKGRNNLRLVSYDPGGALSEPAALEVLVNSAPQVALRAPKGRFTTINGAVRVEWSGSDVNDDAVNYRLELSDDRGRTWKTLADSLKGTDFVWDSTAVPDGSQYMLRVTASDGALVSNVASGRLSVVNDLPAIVLDASGDFFVSEETSELKGFVRSKKDLIKKLEVSFDEGNAWQEVAPEEGTWDSLFEKFSFEVPRLKGGAYQVILRGITVSGRVVINAQNLRIIFDDSRPTLLGGKLPTRVVTKRFLEVGGIVRDDVSGIEAVEYAIDDSGWFQGAVEGGPGVREAQFTIRHTTPIPDGTHKVTMRVIDRAGNVSSPVVQTIRVDATPPRIGSFLLRSGEQIVFPDQGILRVPPGSKLDLLLAIAGNPKKVSLFLNDRAVDVDFNESTGLWESGLTFSEEGMATLQIVARDEVHNRVEKTIATIAVGEYQGMTKEPESVGFWKKLLQFLGQ